MSKYQWLHTIITYALLLQVKYYTDGQYSMYTDFIHI